MKHSPDANLTSRLPMSGGKKPGSMTAWVYDPSNSKLDGRAREAQWVSFDIDSTAHWMYQPKASKVSLECNMKFEPHRMLTISPSMLMDTHPTLPTTPTTSTPTSMADPAPTDPLA